MRAPVNGELVNDIDRNEEFMNWGLGMFVHWSFDSQLGSVISHSIVGASKKYLDRYINELPKTFNPDQYNPGCLQQNIIMVFACGIPRRLTLIL
ncbi:hypothetical protein [Neotamlana sedimentorum]|nr:hypothetical protein [Tamlana sedimentorum]